MPTVPASSLEDINKKQQSKLKRLSFERCVLGFAFSYQKLKEFMSDDDIYQCIVGWTEKDAKEIKDNLNEGIASILSTNGLPTTDKGGITLKLEDPWGIMRDVILMNSKTSSFKIDDAAQYAIAKLGIKAKDWAALVQACTKETPYTTVQVKASKE